MQVETRNEISGSCLATSSSEAHPAHILLLQLDQAFFSPPHYQPQESLPLHDGEDQIPSPGNLQEVSAHLGGVQLHLLLITRGHQFLAGGFK